LSVFAFHKGILNVLYNASHSHEAPCMVLMPTTYHLPKNLGNVAIYFRPVFSGQAVNTTPLTQTKQAMIDMNFAHKKHYFLLMRNTKRACFTALDARIKDAFKVLNDPTIQG
jgi:hypothetical protein